VVDVAHARARACARADLNLRMAASVQDLTTSSKCSVLMVCAHDPSADPRIRWEAEYASAEFEVMVLGFGKDNATTEPNRSVPYRVVRLTRREISGTRFFLFWLAVWPAHRRLSGIGLAIIFLPGVAALEAAINVSRRTVRFMRRVFSGGGASKPHRSAETLSGARDALMLRIVHIVALLRLQFAPAAAIFWEYILQARMRPDVIHCNDLDTLLVGVLAKLKLGSRLVYDAHEFFPVSDPNSRWLDIAFFTMIERFLIHSADAVITVNPMLAKAMKDNYHLGTVHSLPNAEPWSGTRPKVFDPKIRALAGDRVKFLFQGRFAPQRGIEELVEGWAKVNRSKAVLFLRGPDNIWRQRILDLVERLNLLNNAVYFLEPVQEDRLVEAAVEADVGVIPYKSVAINDRLSCPNKLSQYLHAGLMVITNDLPYVKLVVEEAQAGLSYRSDDLSTLVSAVSQITDDPCLLRRSKDNARQFACRKFNWQAGMETLHGLYRNVSAH
jgi:glycosyltransferase involved in cell wall biosynthesis